MPIVTFLAHVPTLRISVEGTRFARGTLWTMPFEAFNAMTLGAFEDHRTSYEATAPVFFRGSFEVDVDIAPIADDARVTAWQLKAREDARWWRALGLGFVADFHDIVMDRVWLALNLAAPAAAFPSPRLSLTLATPDGSNAFKIGDQLHQVATIQGDADLEYLFLEDAASAALGEQDLRRAGEIYDLADTISQHQILMGGVRSLLGATFPALTASEQMILCVASLEGLLLPEVRSGLGSTLAKRLARLVPGDCVEKTARKLYDLRSAGVHGVHVVGEPGIEGAHAQQLLARAIIALADRAGTDGDPVAIAASLDAESELPVGNGSFVEIPAVHRNERLARRRASVVSVFNPSVALGAPPGRMITYAPLVGLAFGDAEPFHVAGRAVMFPFSGEELVSMEERDIRGDFVSKLRMTPHATAVVSLIAKDDTEMTEILLHRERDLGVTALRLAGFHEFHDPELLGTFVYRGDTRFRRPTTLRQTILTEAEVEPTAAITASHVPDIAPHWEMLLAYDASCRNTEIDHLLMLFRRAFHRRFVSPLTRASVLFAALEAMLGRFRPAGDPIQLEHLVKHIAGDTAQTQWFAQRGRKLRNAITHGDVRKRDLEETLDPMSRLVAAVIPHFVRAWIALPDREGVRPGRAFIERVSRGLT